MSSLTADERRLRQLTNSQCVTACGATTSGGLMCPFLSPTNQVAEDIMPQVSRAAVSDQIMGIVREGFGVADVEPTTEFWSIPQCGSTRRIAELLSEICRVFGIRWNECDSRVRKIYGAPTPAKVVEAILEYLAAARDMEVVD